MQLADEPGQEKRPPVAGGATQQGDRAADRADRARIAPGVGTPRRQSADGRADNTSSATGLADLRYEVRLRDWAAMGVLYVGDGFVQSLVGPGAREGMIVIYDAARRAVATTEVAGAPALVASDPVHRRLIGIRFTSAGNGRGEVVEYEY